MWIMSFACLVFVAVMCVIGVLSPIYEDNLAQRLGMALTCLGVLARANEVWYSEAVAPVSLMAHAGLALFAAGVTFKVVIRRAEDRAVRALLTMEFKDLHHVSGGKK